MKKITKKPDSTLKKYNELIKNLEILNKEMLQNPFLFYGETGRNIILILKEIHLEGLKILKSAKNSSKKLKINIFSPKSISL